MRAQTLTVLAGLLLAVTIPGGRAAASPPPRAVDVAVDRASASAVVGNRLTVGVRVVNTGDTATDPLIAHINVASFDQDVYVDLEDWTGNPTRYLAPLTAGASRTLEFELQAVNVGTFAVYVVVVSNAAATPGRTSPTVSPPVRVTVAQRRPLNAAGALPVAVMVPVLLGLAALAARVRVRRASRVRRPDPTQR